jgi:Trk-type K+ transport system membrane component
VILGLAQHEAYAESWLSDYMEDFDKNRVYLTTFYFTVTTITTVGYGDIDIVTKGEKIFCILMMVIGVIAFSLAMGSLTNIIENYDV